MSVIQYIIIIISIAIITTNTRHSLSRYAVVRNMKARMMFHTKDNNDVAIKRKCIGTNTCQLTIQAIEKVDTRRGIRGGEGSDES